MKLRSELLHRVMLPPEICPSSGVKPFCPNEALFATAELFFGKARTKSLKNGQELERDAHARRQLGGPLARDLQH